MSEEKNKTAPEFVTESHHMPVPWHNMVEPGTERVPATEATLKEKTTLVARFGLMTLAVGTSAWRVRRTMNVVSRTLGITCSADIGLLTLEVTCLDEHESYTEAFALRTSAVNTDKLDTLERMVRNFKEEADSVSVEEFHQRLDEVEKKPGNYNAVTIGLAAAFACCAFTFLLGGGIPEMICAFLGAGVGQFIRVKLIHRKITLFGNLICSVMAACITYTAAITLAEVLFHVSDVHEAGYICAMLFVIPGFPLITGGIDLAKLDLRSGIERMMYALLIITVATFTAYGMSYVLQFQPTGFEDITLQPVLHAFMRMLASFMGVFGFSMMFNSTPRMAALAGCVGMLANTLRLELIDFANVPMGLAAFIGAFTAGMIASVIYKKAGYPRVALTVPAIVIMVPGLFLYRGVYYLGLSNISEGAMWLTKALLIILALPLGLVIARILTNKHFRHSS